MARRLGPVCRLCRREGIKLFLKGTRCETPKCSIERRDAPPGMHTRRGKMTDYAIHLREKQKVKHYYGVLERQFRNYFDKAERIKGNTGENLMSLLERRLDNVVHRLGWGTSRRQARQLVAHGHVTVNGRRVDVPSYSVRPGDVIRVRNRVSSLRFVKDNLEISSPRLPDFLSFVNEAIPEGRVLRAPESGDISIQANTQLIIELCSK